MERWSEMLRGKIISEERGRERLELCGNQGKILIFFEETSIIWNISGDNMII